MAPAGLAAVVLAGGAGRRLGGTDKPAIMVGERPLIRSVVEAARAAGARQVIVVGPSRDELPGVVFTSEDPAGGGPVPALRAGLRLTGEPQVLLLAGDLPFLTGEVLSSLASAACDGGGAVLVDDSGRVQWLTSCWEAAALKAALASYDGNSLHGLLPTLPFTEVAVQVKPGEPPCWLDCDTPADLAAARSFAEGLS